MDETFTSKGFWFLPEDQEKQVVGIFTYVPGNRLELELIGSFGDGLQDSVDFFNGKNIKVILGITSGGKKVTLVNCYSVGVEMNFSVSFPILKFKASYCLVGSHLNEYNDKKFTWCNIRIPELSRWHSPSLIEGRINHNKDDISQIEISLDVKRGRESTISSEIDVNTTINLKHEGASLEQDLMGTLNQWTSLEIRRSIKTSFSEFISILHKYESFLSLACLATIKTSEIKFYREDDYQEAGDKKIYHPTELYYIQRGKLQNVVSQEDFLFSFCDIQDIYPEILRKWYNEDESISPLRQHLVNSLKRKKVFESIDFLIVIQAIEGFSIRFRGQEKERDLSRKLKIIIDEFSDVPSVLKLNIDIEAARDSRNYYSHFMNKSKKPKTLHGLELYHLTVKLRIVLICCILSFCGFTNERIGSMLERTNNNRIFL